MGAIDLLARIQKPADQTGRGEPSPRHPWENADLRRVTQAVQGALRRDCPSLLQPTGVSARDQRELRARIEGYLAADPELHLPGTPVASLAGMIFDYVAGLGPVGALLERPDISEIMVNRYDQIWIETDGRLSRLNGVSFRDDLHVFYVAQRVLAPLGVELSAARPLAEGRLPGNIRVAASIPPAGLHTTLRVLTRITQKEASPWTPGGAKRHPTRWPSTFAGRRRTRARGRRWRSSWKAAATICSARAGRSGRN